MSQILGKELTGGLLRAARAAGMSIRHEGKIIPIFTIDEAGWAASGAVVLL